MDNIAASGATYASGCYGLACSMAHASLESADIGGAHRRALLSFGLSALDGQHTAATEQVVL
jgi:hypothetical protein